MKLSRFKWIPHFHRGYSLRLQESKPLKNRDCSEDSEIGVDGSVDPFYTGVPTFSVRRDYCCEEGPPCGLDPVNMCLIPPKGSPTSRTSLRLGSCPMIVTMSTRCVPAVAIWPLAINGVIARCTIS